MKYLINRMHYNTLSQKVWWFDGRGVCLHLEVKGSNLTNCHNPSFGLTTKARAWKCAGQGWARESRSMFPRVQESVREWTLSLPSEFPLSGLDSQWIPNFFKVIVGVKTHWIDVFLIPLEISWNLDI
jgi:hypothetical protein